VKEKYPEYEAEISKGIIRELKKLSSTKKKNARDAKTALLIIPKIQPVIINDETQVDEWIAREALETGFPVCTNDTGLRKRLRSEGVNAFSLTIGGQLR
jgi:rRNA-processing protein FCF1